MKTRSRISNSNSLGMSFLFFSFDFHQAIYIRDRAMRCDPGRIFYYWIDQVGREDIQKRRFTAYDYGVFDERTTPSKAARLAPSRTGCVLADAWMSGRGIHSLSRSKPGAITGMAPAPLLNAFS